MLSLDRAPPLAADRGPAISGQAAALTPIGCRCLQSAASKRGHARLQGRLPWPCRGSAVRGGVRSAGDQVDDAMPTRGFRSMAPCRKRRLGLA